MACVTCTTNNRQLKEQRQMADRWGGKNGWETAKLCDDVEPAIREKARRQRKKKMKSRLMKQKAEIARLEMEVRMQTSNVSAIKAQVRQSQSQPLMRTLPQLPARSRPVLSPTTHQPQSGGNRRRRKKRAARLPRLAQSDDMIENLHTMMHDEFDRPWRNSSSAAALHSQAKDRALHNLENHENFTCNGKSSTDGQSWKRQLRRNRKNGEKQFYVASTAALRKK